MSFKLLNIIEQVNKELDKKNLKLDTLTDNKMYTFRGDLRVFDKDMFDSLKSYYKNLGFIINFGSDDNWNSITVSIITTTSMFALK